MVTSPPELRGIYDTWGEVERLLRGRVLCQMKVYGRTGAKAILDGKGVILGPGLHAFTDGNAVGGIGVVIVEGPKANERPTVLKEIATSVNSVFEGSTVPGLATSEEINAALAASRNPLAEMAALYVAFREVEVGSDITIVYDFSGVGALMKDGGSKAKNTSMRSVVVAARTLATEKRLRPRYVHQPGHSSSWCGRHDLAQLNARADALATEGGRLAPPSPDPASSRLPRKGSVYVVTAPERIRGVYETWAQCSAEVDGVSGARYRKVRNREEAARILAASRE